MWGPIRIGRTIRACRPSLRGPGRQDRRHTAPGPRHDLPIALDSPHDGTPNSANACHGQFVAYFASHGIATPGQAAKWFSEYTGQKVSAGDLNKVVADICDMVHEVPG